MARMCNIYYACKVTTLLSQYVGQVIKKTFFLLFITFLAKFSFIIIIYANEAELKQNGYQVLTVNTLKEFKLRFDTEIDFGIKTVRLGIFDFRSFLNIGMQLTTSVCRAKTIACLYLSPKLALT